MSRAKINSKTKAVEAAKKVFEALDKPKALKYHTLATLCISEGWSHDGKAKAESVMYIALKESIAKGDNIFTAHGRGFFSLKEHNIQEWELPQYIEFKRLGKNNLKRIEAEEEYKQHIKTVCGNCVSIRFNGIKAVTLESGICMHDNSSRCGVKFNAPACPLWQQRPEKQIIKDLTEQAEMKLSLTLIDCNRKRQKVKRAGKVDTIT